MKSDKKLNIYYLELFKIFLKANRIRKKNFQDLGSEKK